MNKVFKRLIPGALIGLAILAAPVKTAIRLWTPNEQLFPLQGATLQSEPAISMGGAGGNTALAAWTDERNTVPDIYLNTWTGSSPVVKNQRATDASVSDPQTDSSPAAALDADGRAFFVYTTQNDVMLARRETNGDIISVTRASEYRAVWYYTARHPAIASDGNADLVVIWQSFKNEQWDLYSARCNGNSMTCAAPVLINTDGTSIGNKTQSRPRMARNGNTVMAVWNDDREYGGLYPHIYSSLSTNGGASWGANTRIDAGGAQGTSALAPSVAVNPASGAIYAIWQQHNGLTTLPADIYAAQWNGSGWVNHARVDAAPAGARAVAPDIAASGAGVFAVWQDYRNGNANPDIYGAKWNGGAWSEHVVSAQVGMQTRPALAASGSSVRVVWQDNRSGHWDIYTALWNGGGWGNEAQVNENAQRASYQNLPTVIAAGNGDFWAGWMDNRDNEERFYASRYSYATKTWAEPVLMPASDGRHEFVHTPPALALDGYGQLRAIWSENNPGSNEQMRIFHAAFNGASWTSESQMSDSQAYPAWSPAQTPALDSRNGKLSAAWDVLQNDPSYSWPPTYTVYSAFWNSASQTWSSQIQVNTDVLRSDPTPSIAVDGAGNTYAAWANIIYSGGALRGDIKIAKYPAGGSGWTQYRIVNSASSPDDWCYQRFPQLKIDAQDRLHVVWNGCQSSNWNMYYATSSDGGDTWSAALPIASGVNSNSMPALALDDSAQPEIMVVYPAPQPDGYRFFAARRLSGAWESGIAVSDGATNWVQWENGRPSIAFDPLSRRFLTVFADKRLSLPQIYGSFFTAGAPTACADFAESNNTPATATSFSAGITQTMYFCSSGDVDWARFTAPAPARYVISSSNLLGGAQPVLQLYASNAVTLLSGGAAITQTLNSGTYYVRVSNTGGFGVSAAYDLSIRAVMPLKQIYMPNTLRGVASGW